MRSLRKHLRALAGVAGVAIVAASCRSAASGGDGPLPNLDATGGLETVLMRFPRDGGLPRSYRWPRLDSAIWVGRDRVPPLGAVLAFEHTDGLLALATSDGRPVRLDLRTGLLQLPGDVMTNPASADGATLYGLAENGRLLRNTASADWRGPADRADSVVALPNGAVILVSHDGERTRLVRMRPPAAAPQDTLVLDRVEWIVLSAPGDRLYASTARGVRAIDTRGWEIVPAPGRSDQPLGLVTTPSGDRVFVLDGNGRTLRIWHRYSSRYAEPAIDLPGPANQLRMDPLGRFVLARTAQGDSLYVVSVALARLVQTIASGWRGDLPTMTPDGALLALRRNDVSVVDPESGTQRLRVRGGAQDYWTFIRWDGFRPRDRSLDAPAVFETDTPADSADAAALVDSLLAANALRVASELEAIGRATAGRRLQEDSTAVAAASGYTVSFASLLSESAARAMAERIRVDGRRPRVVASASDGVTIYRVVAGPYETRDAAVAAGQRSGVPFWVFPGLP